MHNRLAVCLSTLGTSSTDGRVNRNRYHAVAMSSDLRTPPADPFVVKVFQLGDQLADHPFHLERPHHLPYTLHTGLGHGDQTDGSRLHRIGLSRLGVKRLYAY